MKCLVVLSIFAISSFPLFTRLPADSADQRTFFFTNHITGSFSTRIRSGKRHQPIGTSTIGASSGSTSDYFSIISSYPKHLPSKLLRVELSNDHKFSMHSVCNRQRHQGEPHPLPRRLRSHPNRDRHAPGLLLRKRRRRAAPGSRPRWQPWAGVAHRALAHGCSSAVCVKPSPLLVPLLVHSALRNRFTAVAAAEVHASEVWEQVRMAG